MQNIVIATIKEWNISNYFKLKERYKKKYSFHLITNKDELTEEYIKRLKPLYIFFPHWSWIISENIYNNFNCIVFHMTDLPYGRGGSPFQNLIIREVYDTKISALKVDDSLDRGDIYMKEDFNISQGSAQENFTKLSNIIFEKMIPTMLESNIVPKKQVGKVVHFKRRTQEQSNIALLENKSIHKLYDFIRMLDGEGYPKAFQQLENLKIEYMNITKKDNQLSGNFTIYQNNIDMNIYDKWNSLKKQLNEKDKIIKFSQGNIYFMSIGINIGHETYGKDSLFLRPVLVYKKLSKTMFVGIPLTSSTKEGSYYFSFNYKKGKTSTAMLNQIRVLDIRRTEYLSGRINKNIFRNLELKVKDFFSVTPLKNNGE